MDDVRPTCSLGKRGAEKRIKQLLAHNKAERRSVEYLQRVVTLLIPLAPKDAVSRILETAKTPPQTLKGKSDAQKQNKLRHRTEEGTSTAGRQGTSWRTAQNGERPSPHREACTAEEVIPNNQGAINSPLNHRGIAGRESGWQN